MDVELKPGLWPDVPRMLQTIKAAGYTAVPEDVRLTVSGELRQKDGNWTLEVDKLKQPLSIALAVDAKDAKLNAALTAAVDKAVLIESFWQAPPKGETASRPLRVVSLTEQPAAAAETPH